MSYWGLILAQTKSWGCEFWLCQPNTRIPTHVHPTQDNVIMHVWGNALWSKEEDGRWKTIWTNWRTMFRRFRILANQPHRFANSSNGILIFLNFYKPLKGFRITSPAKDILWEAEPVMQHLS